MPPATSNGNGTAVILDSHEDRLQRVEEKVQDVAIGITEIGFKQDSLVERFDKFESWNQKILSEISSAVTQIGEANRKHDARLAPIEAHLEMVEKRAQGRKDLLKKVLIGVLLAGAGVIGTKGVELLFGLVILP